MSTLERAQPWLGTWVSIRAQSGPHGPGALEQAVTAAFAAIAEVHQHLSVHHPASELSRLNQTAHLQPVRVSTPLWQVLRRARQVWQISGGDFDCVRASERLRAWGLLPDWCQTGAQAMGAADPARSDRASLADVALQAGQQVLFRQPLALDVGGIAKGYAVDRAAIVLRQHGVREALINAGGDLRVLGYAPEPIWVRDGRDSQRLHLLGELSHGACATSAVYYSAQTTPGGQPCSALVDPRHGNALLAPHSHTVLARTACMADALTKVLAVRGLAGAQPILARFGAVGLLLDQHGQLHSSS